MSESVFAEDSHKQPCEADEEEEAGCYNGDCFVHILSHEANGRVTQCLCEEGYQGSKCEQKYVDPAYWSAVDPIQQANIAGGLAVCVLVLLAVAIAVFVYFRRRRRQRRQSTASPKRCPSSTRNHRTSSRRDSDHQLQELVISNPREELAVKSVTYLNSKPSLESTPSRTSVYDNSAPTLTTNDAAHLSGSPYTGGYTNRQDLNNGKNDESSSAHKFFRNSEKT